MRFQVRLRFQVKVQFTGDLAWIFQSSIFFRGVVYDAKRTRSQTWIGHMTKCLNLLKSFYCTKYKEKYYSNKYDKCDIQPNYTHLFWYESQWRHNGPIMASQITSLIIVYATVYSAADERKHQSSASLAFCGEFTSDRWVPRTNGQ